jgi:hypothetical protein
LQEIPDDRRVAEAYSRGIVACEALPDYSSLYSRLLAAVAKPPVEGQDLRDQRGFGAAT